MSSFLQSRTNKLIINQYNWKKQKISMLPSDENELKRTFALTLSVKARFVMVLVPYRTKSRFGVCSWSSGQRFTIQIVNLTYNVQYELISNEIDDYLSKKNLIQQKTNLISYNIVYSLPKSQDFSFIVCLITD
ncbi:hypothetical protein BpHYR1_027525 [Brachionus plicatilis]|uniref:Uncharacterized protein n=1 Tax=Brachionus plicatilis TaxID=10195 RepID=A0A3M7SNU1_BRAPC|nr:hypothetical protein BpHYR1_027525 [Brachionus plicatilis]